VGKIRRHSRADDEGAGTLRNTLDRSMGMGGDKPTPSVR
jgi:hypothetical protein